MKKRRKSDGLRNLPHSIPWDIAKKLKFILWDELALFHHHVKT